MNFDKNTPATRLAKSEGWHHILHWNSHGKFFDMGVHYVKLSSEGCWYGPDPSRLARPRFDSSVSGLLRLDGEGLDGHFMMIGMIPTLGWTRPR